MLKKMKSFYKKIVIAATCTAFLLSGCGNFSNTSLSSKKQSASTSAISLSGTAIGEESDSVDRNQCMEITVGYKTTVHVPNPEDSGEKAVISLKKNPEDSDVYWNIWEKGSTKEKEAFFGDFSFAGFQKPMFVSSYAVGYFAEKGNECAVMTDEETGKNTATNGNCLALYLTDCNAEKNSYDPDKTFYTDDNKFYLLILDYANHRFYKTRVNNEMFERLGSWNEFSLGDVTGDGLSELMVSKYHNKSDEYQVFHTDRDTGTIDLIFTSNDEKFLKKNRDSDLFSSVKTRMMDDYKIKVSNSACGWETTVSLLEDCLYSKDQLNVNNQRDTENWIPHDIKAWDNDGKYVGKLSPSLSHEGQTAEFVTDNSGNTRLRLENYIDLIHRDNMGIVYTYLTYDSEKKVLVMDDAVFYTERQRIQRLSEALDTVFKHHSGEKEKFEPYLTGKKTFTWLHDIEDNEQKTKNNIVTEITKKISSSDELTLDEFYDAVCKERGVKKEKGGVGLMDCRFADVFQTGETDLILSLSIIGGGWYGEDFVLHSDGENMYGIFIPDLFTTPVCRRISHELWKEKKSLFIAWVVENELYELELQEKVSTLSFKDGSLSEHLLAYQDRDNYYVKGKKVSERKFYYFDEEEDADDDADTEMESIYLPSKEYTENDKTR